MMRVCPAASGTDGEPAKDEDDSYEQKSNDVEIGMVRSSCWRGTEPGLYDRNRYDDAKDEGAEQTMGEDEAVILRDGREPIAHAWTSIVLASEGT